MKINRWINRKYFNEILVIICQELVVMKDGGWLWTCWWWWWWWFFKQFKENYLKTNKKRSTWHLQNGGIWRIWHCVILIIPLRRNASHRRKEIKPCRLLQKWQWKLSKNKDGKKSKIHVFTKPSENSKTESA